MTDRTILITGATDGLGRALARGLAAGGDTVILHGRDETRLKTVADEIGGRTLTVCADLADLAQVRRLAADVRGATDRLDVLVSNAGIGGGLPVGRERATSARRVRAPLRRELPRRVPAHAGAAPAAAPLGAGPDRQRRLARPAPDRLRRPA